MNAILVISILASFVCLTLGINIYSKKGAKENKLFFVLCTCYAIWSISIALKVLLTDGGQAVILYKISIVAYCIVSFLSLWLLLVYSKVKMHNNVIFLTTMFLLSFVLNLDKLLDLNVSYNVFLGLGLFNILHVIHSILFFLLGFIVILIKAKKINTFRKKMHFSILGVCGVVSWIINSLYYVVLHITASVEAFYSIEHVVALIWITSIWYVIKNYSIIGINQLINTEDIINMLKDLIIVVNDKGHIMSVNKGVLKVVQYKENELIGENLSLIFREASEIFELARADLEPILKRNIDSVILARGRREIPVSISITEVRNAIDELAGIVIVAQDMRLVEALRQEIKDHKKAQNELSYLSYHDSLTGLFNRSSFEYTMRQLDNSTEKPIAIIICDLDGLKLINDTLGHEDGDELITTAAKVISKSLDGKGMMARIGGDEFSIIVTGTSHTEIELICKEIADGIENYNSSMPRLPLSVSIGFAIGEDSNISMRELFKQADNNMYRKKLYQSQHTKDNIIKSLIKALNEKDFIDKGHADRIYNLMVKLSLAMGYPEYKLNKLWLLAQFHDIGKVGVPDKILFKTKPLEMDEISEIKRHCEIGYRIARSSQDLEPVSELILRHHEWWNGKGYPLGLQGEQIPLECRILAIADAYDVMTTDRPYRSSMESGEALKEIMRFAGRQFDPYLVDKFVEVISCREILG
jgi:diguanylate cyclase (GGDEF)-like protein/PAS domain S-box-containing protein